MAESLPPISFRSLEDYYNDFPSRLHEQEMDTHTVYPFITRLIWSRQGNAAEFRAQLTEIAPIDQTLGHTALVLRILQEENKTLIAMNASAVDGLIYPEPLDEATMTNQSRRIVHHRLGHIGVITEGYMLGPSSQTSRKLQTPTSVLYEQQPL